MTSLSRTSLAVAGVFWSLLGSAMAAPAPTPAQFYGRHPLTIVVASGAGGGYDTYSRVLASHLGGHVPGEPKVVVENMPGAAGLVATNWAYNQAPKDGSTILATYSALLDSNLLGNKKAKFDIRKFGWIGSIASSPLICVTWANSPYRDIRQMIGKPLRVSATGRTAKSATMPLLLNAALGTKFQVISGYSTSGSTLALERGEVDAICGIGLSTLTAAHPDWISAGKVHVVAQIDLKKISTLKGVPNALDLATPKGRDLIEYEAILEELGRPYLAPPDTPADRLQALRQGFDETMKDPAFVGNLTKLGLSYSPIDAARMESLIGKLYGFSARTIHDVARIDGISGD